MKTFDLKGTIRKNIGSRNATLLRKKDQVPCILYGGKENITFSSDSLSFQKLIYTPDVYLVNLDIDGNKYKAKVQDIQFDAITDCVSHVDFLEITDDKKIIVSLPVKIIGSAPGVLSGGKLRTGLRKLKVRGMANDLPDVIEIDISKLGINDHILVKNLSYDKFELLDPPSSLIVGVFVARAVVEEEAKPAEVAATAEGSAPAATGTAPPAGAKDTTPAKDEKAKGEKK